MKKVGLTFKMCKPWRSSFNQRTPLHEMNTSMSHSCLSFLVSSSTYWVQRSGVEKENEPGRSMKMEGDWGELNCLRPEVSCVFSYITVIKASGAKEGQRPTGGELRQQTLNSWACACWRLKRLPGIAKSGEAGTKRMREWVMWLVHINTLLSSSSRK